MNEEIFYLPTDKFSAMVGADFTLSKCRPKGGFVGTASLSVAPVRDRMELDTSVIMHDRGCLKNFGEHDVNITLTSIEELDRLKDGSRGSDGRKGFLAREALKALAEFEDADLLGEGAPLPGGGRLFLSVADHASRQLPRAQRKKFPLNGDSPDNQIIYNAWCVAQQKSDRYRQVRFISKDLGQRIKARACGLMTEDYLHDRIGSIEELYEPFHSLEFNYAGAYDEFVSRLMSNRKDGVSIEHAEECGAGFPDPVYANQCFVATSLGEARPGLNVVLKMPHGRDSGRLFWVEDFTPNPRQCRYIAPRNPEQHMAYNFLIDPSIQLVSLLGCQGTGKTLLAVQAGLEQVKDHYSEIIVFRPNIELGSPMGFLPGGLDEKFAPWMRPVFDQFEAIGNAEKSRDRSRRGSTDDPDKERAQDRNFGFTLMEEGFLSIEPIAYIRGRSFHRKLVIVDEAQNLTPQEIKIMVGRAGAGTKLVLAGDAKQVDHKYLDAFSNGLSHVTERFRGQKNFAFVALQKAERSYLAEQADSLL